jgi:UDP-N-acetylmuramyl pentapeptide phosphotransferase/UDP-N-acetylglucosamine-1-phosphate transferase|tara:strand:- start:43 stop:525 length:483 start_codon:yes stop_codon:yes gene_type:complete
MANTTFSGPVRSENGFDLINKNSVGEQITDIGLEVIEKSLTVANGATTGTTTDTLPTNFIAVSAVVVVTTASSNAVNIADLGVTGDTDGYLDGINVAANSAGFKGHFSCNGTDGLVALAGGTAAATAAPAGLIVTLSGDPGSDTVIKVKVFGISSSSDTE